MIEFKEFAKIVRLNREVIVSEKLDGTNAAVVIDEEGNISAQSRTRLITPEDDNYGFARWVEQNRTELMKLGHGHHFGEWWGSGVQRGYGLTEKRFSLFNVSRWSDEAARPACCHVVPVIYRGEPTVGFDICREALERLKSQGSFASPGFMKPEGIVAFHVAANMMFKATIDKDEEWKGKSKRPPATTHSEQS
jgi:hypothetical protein